VEERDFVYITAADLRTEVSAFFIAANQEEDNDRPNPVEGCAPGFRICDRHGLVGASVTKSRIVFQFGRRQGHSS
jgi:hypothetical protein